MAKDRYGVVLLGCYGHAHLYARALAAHPRAKIVVVADEPEAPGRSVERNRAMAEQYGVAYTTDLDAALGRDDADIAVICSEIERIGRLAVRAAGAGLHVWLDKPVAGSLADADAIVEAVEAAGVRSLAYGYVFTSYARNAKRALQEDLIGDPLAVHADVIFAKGDPGDVVEVRPRIEAGIPSVWTLPGVKRELFEIGVYAVGLVRYLTGREVESVYGTTGNYVFGRHAEMDIEDFGTLSCTLRGGLIATVTGGRIGARSHPFLGPFAIQLAGTRGALSVDGWRPHVRLHTERREAAGFFGVPYGGNEDYGLAHAAEHFIACIESGRETDSSARDGCALVETLLAGYESARTDDVVVLPLPRPVAA